jgi:hypothetical protein
MCLSRWAGARHVGVSLDSQYAHLLWTCQPRNEGEQGLRLLWQSKVYLVAFMKFVDVCGVWIWTGTKHT